MKRYNKTRTSKVGAISKAQKEQNIFFEKKLKISEKNAQCRKKIGRRDPLVSSGYVDYLNQSRIYGKGVSLGIFPSDSLQSQSYEFIEIAQICTYYGVENNCRNFRSNHMGSFCKNQKKSKNGCFLAIFGLILAMFLTSQPYEFNEIAHIGL